MTIVRFLADDQDLKVVARIKLASGNKKSVILQVKFSKEWDGYTKHAVFSREDNPENPYRMLLVEDQCLIPYEVMEQPGAMMVWIWGVTPDTEKTTSSIRYDIDKGPPNGTGTPIDPTPDIYQQILARLKEMETITHSWRGTVLTVTSSAGSSSADLQGVSGQTPTIEAERFEAANYWEMSSQDANGNAVYLYPGNSGSAGYPNRAAEYSRLNLTAGSEENTFSIVANDADVSNMDSCYLYFDRSNLRWDRVSSPGSNATWKTNTSLRLYRAAVEGEDSSTEIPGYVRITSLDYVVEGRYLIAAPGNDGGIYLLYPSTAAANRYQQTAKVIDGNTAGIGSDSSYSAGTVALTACLYTFAKDAESWESGVNLTVTNLGTDGQEDTRTAVRVLDGKDGYTPVKGTDYYTEADKTEMVNAVIAALPVYNGEVVAI